MDNADWIDYMANELIAMETHKLHEEQICWAVGYTLTHAEFVSLARILAPCAHCDEFLGNFLIDDFEVRRLKYESVRQRPASAASRN